jgi:hypothetical protein
MRITFAVVAVLLLVLPAAAADESHGTGSEAEHASSRHHDFRHELALFAGGTDEQGHDTELTLGLEYAYELSPKIALGPLLEHVGGELRNTILAVPLHWKPAGGLILLAGPGVEYHEGRGRGDEDDTHFLFRLGVGYNFHLGERYSVLPSVNLDLVDGEEVWVWGASFGVMF